MEKKELFIIMPFNTKKGKLDHYNQDADIVEINFDEIWKEIIIPSIPKDKFIFKRADEMRRPGLIDRIYIKWLINSDVVLADLTFGNPNVYYELGMRHVLSKKGTILIAQEGTKLPFDVRNQSVLYYNNFKATSLKVFQKDLKTYILNALSQSEDSPVHTFFPDIRINLKGETAENLELKIKELENQNLELQKEIERIKLASNEERLLLKVRSTLNKSRLISIYGSIKDKDINSLQLLEELAIKLRKVSLFEFAINILNKAIALNPNDSDINRELGFIYRKLGPENYDKAEEYFNKALRLNDHDPELLGMLAGMHKRKGDIQKAFSLYKKAYNFENDNLYSIINVASLSLILEGIDKSYEYYEKIENVALKDIESKNSDHWTYFCLAQAYIILSKPLKEILEVYNEAINLEPPIEDIKSESEQLEFLKIKSIEVDKIDIIQDNIFNKIIKSM